jgi:hypothetical protein
MATKPDFVINSDVLALVEQISDEREAMEAWWDITQWAAEFYRQTGEPATLDDLYRDLPGMLRDEEYEVEVV